MRDGEGAKRVGRVVVRGGHEATVVARAARAVANSPLVKAALHGGDPNWGRIAQAVGAALPDTAPLRARHLRSRTCRCAPAGAAIALRRGGARRRRSPATRSSTTVVLPGDGAEAEVFFSDLSHEYVTINADYTT